MNLLDTYFNRANDLLDDETFIRNHSLHSKDFTRFRKLSFKYTWWCMLGHTGSSLMSEMALLPRKFHYEIDSVSPQAFSKARNKITYTACEELFKLSAQCLSGNKTYKGYFLAAVDGTKLLPPDTKEIQSSLGICGNHIYSRAGASASILYDPLSDHIINGVLSNINTPERERLKQLIEGVDIKNTILLLDRGYPSKDIYRFLEQHSLKYVIRVPIGSSTPRYIREAIKDDQILTDPKNPDLTHRILRIQLSNDNEEVLISNILDPDFP